VTATLALALDLLAQQQPRDTGPDFGKASPFGLLIVVLLLIGTGLLVWSMNRHLRKLPKSFENESPEDDRGVEGGTVGAEPDPPTDGTKHEPGG
jgi:hypothetical protein